jgi:hypothetical protein
MVRIWGIVSQIRAGLKVGFAVGGRILNRKASREQSLFRGPACGVSIPVLSP